MFCFAVAASIAAGASPKLIGDAPLAPSRTGPAPRAVTPFTSFNFGEVYSGEVISQVFVVRNEGDGELLLADFKAG